MFIISAIENYNLINNSRFLLWIIERDDFLLINQLKIELIIFDMDGLMFDTEKISFVSWRDAAARYGYQIDNEIFRKTIGANLIRTKDIYLNHFGSSFPIEEIISERVRISEEIMRIKGVPVKKDFMIY